VSSGDQAAPAPKYDAADYEKFRIAAKRAETGAAIARFVLWCVLVVGAIVFMMPLYIMVVLSLKTTNEIANSSAWAWPQHLTWDNFSTVLNNPNAPFFLFFRNSTIVATFSTLGVIVSSSLVAYPFARTAAASFDGKWRSPGSAPA